jgi:hypothetical protein
MIAPCLSTAASEPGTSSALYVILAGLVCTALGWILRGWHSRQTPAAPEKTESAESAGEGTPPEEKGAYAEKLASVEAALAVAETARKEALRELETLRPKAASHDEAHERARQLESGHRKALEDLIAAESALKSMRAAGAELDARARTADAKAGTGLEQRTALEKQLNEIRTLETAAREAASKALEESQAATELNTRLHRELEEARAAAEEARAATAAEQSRAEQLVKDLDAARGRVAAIESAPSVPRPVSADTGAVEDGGVSDNGREALSRALEESREASELNACLRRELEEARAALQEANAAAASEQTRAAQLTRELEAVRSRPEVPAGDAQDELHKARREAEAVRAELKAATEEIRKLKSELSAPKPRPILTSPRPDAGAGGGAP